MLLRSGSSGCDIKTEDEVQPLLELYPLVWPVAVLDCTLGVLESAFLLSGRLRVLCSACSNWDRLLPPAVSSCGWAPAVFLCERRSDPPGLLLGRLDIGTSLLKGHTLSRHYHSLCLRRTPPRCLRCSPAPSHRSAEAARPRSLRALLYSSGSFRHSAALLHNTGPSRYLSANYFTKERKRSSQRGLARSLRRIIITMAFSLSGCGEKYPAVRSLRGFF